MFPAIRDGLSVDLFQGHVIENLSPIQSMVSRISENGGDETFRIRSSQLLLEYFESGGQEFISVYMSLSQGWADIGSAASVCAWI